MRITQEADYALRICALLAQAEKPLSTPQLSEKLFIPPSFTAKILRKLSLKRLVKAVRGINGGFKIADLPESITLKNVIEAIDGEIAIRHCLLCEHTCNYQKDKSKCRFHAVFKELNAIISSRLELLTLKDMINDKISADELVMRLHIN